MQRPQVSELERLRDRNARLALQLRRTQAAFHRELHKRDLSWTVCQEPACLATRNVLEVNEQHSMVAHRHADR